MIALLVLCFEIGALAVLQWLSTSPLFAMHNLTNSSKGTSRCFPFWQEVLACYVVNTSAEDESGKKKCVPVLEDYYECLHHKKEVSVIPAKALLYAPYSFMLTASSPAIGYESTSDTTCI